MVCQDCGKYMMDIRYHKLVLRDCTENWLVEPIIQVMHDGHVDCDCLTEDERQTLMVNAGGSRDYREFYAPQVPR